MQECYVVEIVTPKKVVLNGLWFGPKKATRCIVWIHGLGGSVFSNRKYLSKIVDHRTAVLTFNNRGHGIINGIKYKIGRHGKYGYGRYGGEAHEVFTDSFDDVEGAVQFARRNGAKKIFVGGSSTGSQKTMYWASRTKNLRNVTGLILAVPLSDYASILHFKGKEKTLRALRIARTLVKNKKKHSLLPQGVWHQPFDAQRFLSLYSGKGPEEIFTYWNENRTPKILQKIKKPTLVLLAGSDEYSDRPIGDIKKWFEKNIKAPVNVTIVPHTGHSFRGAEVKVVRIIRRWIKGL